MRVLAVVVLLIGITGNYCDNVCQNGGTFSCDCPYGYTGAFCENLIDFCNGTVVVENGAYVHVDICGDHGTCANTQTGPVCTCAAGWTGQWCEDDIDDCASAPCENGATCVNMDGPSYECCCDPLHTGSNCENNVDFCEYLQILNGTNGQPVNVPVCGDHGTCVTTPSGAMCICDHLWMGQFCQTEIPFSCTYKNNQTYPHNSTWVDGCDSCQCQFGNVQCSNSFWCPTRCALYSTPATVAAGVSTTCPPNQNCIPEDVSCAKPTCANPIGWCFPVGIVMVDVAPVIPTNGPNGWQWG